MKNKVSKIFVQVYALDIEGRNGEWTNTEKTYADAVNSLDAWTNAVRMVEKTFDPETFIITTKEIKRTEKVLEGYWWNGETRETDRYAG